MEGQMEQTASDSLLSAPNQPHSFDCPRCSTAVTEEYYGPCVSCMAELRATYAGEAREVTAAAYEPKMNVTPNAVALKD